jgi:hypothetical protein
MYPYVNEAHRHSRPNQVYNDVSEMCCWMRHGPAADRTPVPGL